MKPPQKLLPIFTQAFLLLFLFFLPTQLGKHFFLPFSYISGARIDYLAPTLYFTDIIAVSLIVLNIKTVFAFSKNKYLLVVLALLILNVLLAISQPIAAYKFLKIIEVLCLIAIFKNTIKVNSELVLYSLTFSALFEVILSTVQIINKSAVQGIFYWFGERALSISTPDVAKASIQGVQFLRPYGTFSHPNSMAGFYLVLFFLVLLYEPFKKYQLLKNITLCLCGLLVFLSFSKITIVTFFALNILYIFTHRKNLFCKICIVARPIIFFVLMLIVLTIQGDPFTAEKRIGLMQNALTIIIHHPIWGVGLGNYLYAQADFPIKYPYLFLQPVHNIFLLFFTELGIVFGGIILFFIIRLLRKYLRYETVIYAGLAILITGTFDHYWFTLQQNILLLPLLFGLL